MVELTGVWWGGRVPDDNLRKGVSAACGDGTIAETLKAWSGCTNVSETWSLCPYLSHTVCWLLGKSSSRALPIGRGADDLQPPLIPSPALGTHIDPHVGVALA